MSGYMLEKGKNEDILTLPLQYIFVGNASIYESAGEVYLLAQVGSGLGRVGAERNKFGGYRQNGEKNLVEPAVKRIFAHKSEDKWK